MGNIGNYRLLIALCFSDYREFNEIVVVLPVRFLKVTKQCVTVADDAMMNVRVRGFDNHENTRRTFSDADFVK